MVHFFGDVVRFFGKVVHFFEKLVHFFEKLVPSTSKKSVISGVSGDLSTPNILVTNILIVCVRLLTGAPTQYITKYNKISL